MLLLRLINPHISLPFSNLSTGLRSTNALNINSFLLPTKFLQPLNLTILTIWSLFNPFAVLAHHLLSPFLARQPSPHWKSLIARSAMHHPVFGMNSQIHSVSLASHVSTHLLIQLSAYYCHHQSVPYFFTPGSKPTFSTPYSNFNTSPTRGLLSRLSD